MNPKIGSSYKVFRPIQNEGVSVSEYTYTEYQSLDWNKWRIGWILSKCSWFKSHD
jgi:hypothetical protein